VLRAQDIVVLLKVADVPQWTIRSASADLGMSHAGVQRSLKRLEQSGLYDGGRRRARRAQAEEFLVHGLRYIFPATLNGETRGLPTAWAAEPLAGHLAPVAELPPVWPDPLGPTRGLAVEPLHAGVPELARRDSRLGQQLALIDGLRLGDARVRQLAATLLHERLVGAAG
jgi:DNA-binding transcriptional MocR family regulator